MSNKNKIFFTILSVIALLINITLAWDIQVPWIDDTWSIDPAVNWFLKGEVYTTVWKDIRGASFLFTLLNYTWFKMVGFSFIKARLLVIILGYLSFLTLFLIYQLITDDYSKVSAVSLFFLIGITPNLIWTVTNGRMDSLVILLVLNLIYLLIKGYKSSKINYKMILVISVLLGMTYGLAGIIYLFFILSLLFLIGWIRLKVPFFIIFGVLVGITIHFVFVYFVGGYGVLRSVIKTTIGFSQSLTTLINFLYFYGLIPKNLVDFIGVNSSIATNSSGWIGYFEYSNNNVLLVVFVVLFLLFSIRIYRHKIQITTRCKFLLSLLFMIIIPIYMNLAGRFVFYYQWMFLLPLILSIVYLMNKNLIVSVFVFLFVVGANFSEWKKMVTKKNTIPDFLIENLSDTVLCSEVFYHSVKNHGKELTIYNRENSERLQEVIQNNRMNTTLLVHKNLKNRFAISDFLKFANIGTVNYSVYRDRDTLFSYSLKCK